MKLPTKFISLIPICSLLTACMDDGTNTVSKHPQNIPKIAQPELPSLRVPKEFSPHARQVANAVQESKARLASQTSEICPKLIEFTVDNSRVIRQNEKMERFSCKYFIYPDVGTNLNVEVNNNQLKANLVQPQFYNFANGSYKVESNGKHVLEISYKQHHGDRPSEKYKLTISHY